MTFMFMLIILGSTHPKATARFAGIAIGLALTLIHLISICYQHFCKSCQEHKPGFICNGLGNITTWVIYYSPDCRSLAGRCWRSIDKIIRYEKNYQLPIYCRMLPGWMQQQA